MLEIRRTVGEISTSLLQKDISNDHSAEEQMREMLENWEKNIFEVVKDGKKIYSSDFYLVVETKKEPKMQNVLRNYFFHRVSCPTPTYDNSVYKYHRADDKIEFLWVLPDKNTYRMLKENALELLHTNKELIQFVLDDSDGTLLRRCKIYNGEIKE